MEPIKYTRIGVFDIDGVYRGKLVHPDKLASALQDGFGFCNVIWAWDIVDELYDPDADTHYPDLLSRIDASTHRVMPWLGDQDMYIADFYDEDRAPAYACPRSLLRRIQEEAAQLGYFTKFAAEYEWFNFVESPQSIADKNYVTPQPITPGMFGYSTYRLQEKHDFVQTLLSQLSHFGVPVEGIHTETGPGVYEACLKPADALEAADRAALFKMAVKELARQHEMIACFMAKWNAKLPGCGGHIHQSIWDVNGHNMFSAKSNKEQSPYLNQYLAGILHCLPDLQAMYAPTVNSYKRYIAGSWAATGVNWGIENRTTAVRVIQGRKPAHARIEFRVSGADANPYLVMAATLASGLYGIKNKLKLDDYPPVRGSAYHRNNGPQLATTLAAAVDRMQQSKLAKELFGADFVKHYVMTRRHEYTQYQRAVTDYEIKRYMESI